MEKLLLKILELGWTIENKDDCYIIKKHTSTGYEFSFTICTKGFIKHGKEMTAELFLEAIFRTWNEYDTFIETCKRIDNMVGKENAIYNKATIYKETKECQEMLYELYKDLYDYYYEKLQANLKALCTE